MAAGAIKTVFVEFVAKTSRFNNSLKKADAQVKKSTMGLKVMAAALTGAVVLGLRKASREFDQFAERGDNIAKLSRGLRMTLAELTELQFVLERLGGDETSARNMMVSLDKALGEASAGSKEYVDSFADMNLNWAELVKMRPAERFYEIRRALQASEGDVRAMAGATIVLGRGLKANLPVMQATQQEIDDIREHFSKLGGISPEAARLAETIKDLDANWALLKDTIASVAFEVIAPGVIKTREEFEKWVISLKESGALVTGVKVAIIGLVSVFVALSAAIVGIGIALAPVGLAFGAIITAVAGVSAAVVSLTLHWSEFWQALKLVWNDLLGFAKDITSGIIGKALSFFGFGDGGSPPQSPEMVQRAAGLNPQAPNFVGLKSIANGGQTPANVTNFYQVSGVTADQLDSRVRRQNESQLRGNRR